MKTWRTLWLLLALAGLALAAAGPAQADCWANGTVVYSYYDPTANPPYAYFYVGDPVINGHVYYFKTTDPQVGKLLSAAQAAGFQVEVQGGATNCPGSGLARNGGVIKAANMTNIGVAAP